MELFPTLSNIYYSRSFIRFFPNATIALSMPVMELFLTLSKLYYSRIFIRFISTTYDLLLSIAHHIAIKHVKMITLRKTIRASSSYYIL